MSEEHAAWCTVCGARFTEAEIAGKSNCPKCGDTGIPCDPSEDLSVRVNWHELRVLGIWAENWAQKCEEQNPGDPGNARPKVVHAITRRLERQFPGKTPLTLSGELAGLKKEYEVEGIGIAATSVLPVNGPGAVIED